MSERTQVVLLGTGTPNAEPDRQGPSLAIVVGDVPYLVDFGPGVVRRATAAVEKGVTALRPENLKLAYLTHLHSDHTLGYADLVFTPWVLGRNQPLGVFGPPGLAAMTEHILKAYEADIHERRMGLEEANNTGYKVKAVEIEPGARLQSGDVTIEAFAVNHGAWPAYGYKFTTPDRTIVISGDTAPVESVVEQAKGCDVLIHEVYSVAGFRKRPPEWQRYHASVHTSAHQLAEIANQAQPGLLVLVHQLLWGTSEEELLEEVKEGYSGEVMYGRDLDIL